MFGQTQTLPNGENASAECLNVHVLQEQSNDVRRSTSSFDEFCSDILGDRSFIGSPRHTLSDSTSGDESTSISVESSPLGWPLGRWERYRLGKLQSLPKNMQSRDGVVLKERTENPEDAEIPEIEMMKERFAKLLLGEDLSGGSKGVCTALAISNAITNLAASLFGELRKLEPLAQEREARWRREMEWLLAVSDQIVEFVPSCRTLPDGSMVEVMVTKPRSDLQINLPALRKLDTMLIESLRTFNETEFWYTDGPPVMREKDGLFNRQEEKWWLPTPRVPSCGLSQNTRKQIQSKKCCINQVLKAALAINAQVLSEMEVPNAYWETLPKNGRSSLGELLYHIIASDSFVPEALLSSLESCKQHSLQELLNRVEAAVHIWHRKIQTKQVHAEQKEGKSSIRTSLSFPKDLLDLDRRKVLVERAESLYLLLRQKFPTLPQTILDVNKIQHNKDVGKSILESYSRVLESVASIIVSRIDDVLFVDDLTKNEKSSLDLCKHSAFDIIGSNSIPPCVRLNTASVFSLHSAETRIYTSPGKVTLTTKPLSTKPLSDHLGRNLKVCSEVEAEQGISTPIKSSRLLEPHKSWSYMENMNSQWSPPSRH